MYKRGLVSRAWVLVPCCLREEIMQPRPRVWIFAIWVLTSVAQCAGQQVTAEDYARAEQFLPWNASKLMSRNSSTCSSIIVA